MGSPSHGWILTPIRVRLGNGWRSAVVSSCVYYPYLLLLKMSSCQATSLLILRAVGVTVTSAPFVSHPEVSP
jgi:hypothetical protein